MVDNEGNERVGVDTHMGGTRHLLGRPNLP